MLDYAREPDTRPVGLYSGDMVTASY